MNLIKILISSLMEREIYFSKNISPLIPVEMKGRMFFRRDDSSNA